MSCFKIVVTILAAVLLLFCLNITAFSQSEETVTIVTPVPAPKETYNVPQNPITCFTVGAGWYRGVWYADHRVCQYDPDKVRAAQGDAWIDGYWACTKYSADERLQGQCTNWDWKPGHWVKTLPVY